MGRKERTLTVIELLRSLGGNRGLTILELCVALLVIAVLVTAAVPILLNTRKKADKTTAEYNLKIGASCLDRLWFQMLDRSNPPDNIDSYRDFDPPDVFKSSDSFKASGFTPVDAQYMSYYETKIKWAELVVEDSSSPIAAADISGLALDSPSGYKVNGVYRAGNAIETGPQLATDWSVLPGKIGVVENKFYWDGGWQENENNLYVTLITLEHCGVAHFMTMRQGTIADYGSFDWKDGKGNPGEGWKGDTKPENPPAPGDSTQPTQPTQPTEPAQPTEPTQPTQPVEPTQPTEPTQPVEPQPDQPPVASIRIEPETLNLRSNGDFTIFIEMEFSSGHTVNDLDTMSLTCYSASAVGYTISSDNKLVVKFDRRDLRNVPVGDQVKFVVQGKYTDGSDFEQYDIVRVIE